MKTANRLYRKHMARMVRNGQRNLRVMGTQADGFHLVAEGKTPIVVGPVAGFAKQKDAVSFGQVKFGQTARKLLATKAA